MNLWETPTACITHASTKLSRQFANYFASKGYALLLTGLNRTELKSIAESIRWEYQVSVNIAILDLTNTNNAQSFISHWIHDSNIEVFINNVYGLFEENLINMENHQESYLLEIILSNINIISQAVSQEFDSRDKGSLISIALTENKNTSTSLPEDNQRFLITLHKQLTEEYGRERLNFQVLCPCQNGRIQPKAVQEMWEEQIVRESIRGLIKKSPVVKCSMSSPFTAFLAQLIPSWKEKHKNRRKYHQHFRHYTQSTP